MKYAKIILYSKTHFHKSAIFQNVQIMLKLVIIKHIIECLIELIRNFLDLELLTIDLIFNVINPMEKKRIRFIIRNQFQTTIPLTV